MAVPRRRLYSLDFSSHRSQLGEPWLRVWRMAMSCRVEVTLARADAELVPAAREALDEADRIESLLSVFRKDTEVSRINAAAATQVVDVSAEVFALIERSVQLHAETQGAFDITSTPLSRCWGFMRREQRAPNNPVIERARALVGIDRVLCERAGRRVSFARPGVELNFGAIGKGYAVDRMAAMLRRAGAVNALVSAGGSSLVAIGGTAGGWPVDVSSPLLPGQRIARLSLRDAALGTSGTGEQPAIPDGVRYGHVIDPRSGWPARGVLWSTVVAASAADADALSTAFLVDGPTLAHEYCSAHPDTLALLVLEDDVSRPRVFGQHPGARIEA
jgi:FAD:protein FMN transferase